MKWIKGPEGDHIVPADGSDMEIFQEELHKLWILRIGWNVYEYSTKAEAYEAGEVDESGRSEMTLSLFACYNCTYSTTVAFSVEVINDSGVCPNCDVEAIPSGFREVPAVFVSAGGNVACDKHGGEYLASQFAALSVLKASFFGLEISTPLDTWTLVRIDELGFDCEGCSK